MFSNHLKSLIIFFIIFIIIPTFFIPTIILSSDINFELDNSPKNDYFDISTSSFMWPLPGYTKISSYFGKRNSPVTGR